MANGNQGEKGYKALFVIKVSISIKIIKVNAILDEKYVKSE
jgi:hypothetical protein